MILWYMGRTCSPAHLAMTQGAARRPDGVFVLTEGSYDCLITTQFKAQSEKSPAISLRGYNEIKSSKFLNSRSILDKGWAQSPALLPSAQAAHIQRMRVLDALQYPQINSCRKRPSGRTLGPRERHCCCLTSAGMQGDGGKQIRDIFAWGRKQMWFLQLLQKKEQMPPEMHSCPKKCHWGGLANQAELHWGLLWETRYHHMQCQPCRLPRAEPTDETHTALDGKEVGISP